ncbi:MAG: helix-turn-helix domain-containing protein [Kordiimonadaceae bacterium]|nr:helix-turn-helix domain-containing protein [Kordiimonadaceae bacterium]
MTNHKIRKNLLRAGAAAEYCGLSKSTLDKYRVTGEGPVYFKLGRAVLYKTDDLDNWINSNRKSSTSDA